MATGILLAALSNEKVTEVSGARKMFDIHQNEKSIMFTLSPDKHLVERVLEEADAFFPGRSASDFAGVKVVLRELLFNAIEYGACGEHEDEVSCWIERLTEPQVKITVEDHGEGFRPDTVNMSLPENPKHVDHRGYILINALSDRLEFNDKANRITAYISIPAGKNAPPGVHILEKSLPDDLPLPN